MTNTYRALCAELADSLENARRIIKGADGTLHINTAEFVLRRARAALAEPEAEGPSDEDLYDLAEVFNDDPVPAMRRALELWGRPAAEPAPEPGPKERPRELQWPASVAQGCHEAAAEAESGSPLQQLLVAAGDLLERGRPAAAQPSDEELLATLNQAVADFPPRHSEAEAMNAVEYPLALELRKARAVLARWGRPAAAPVPVWKEPDHVNLIGFAFGREPWATWLRSGGCLESAHCELADLMLAAIARWGHQPPPPASKNAPRKSCVYGDES